MPRNTEAVLDAPVAPFVPYTIDVTSQDQHMILHSGLAAYAEQLKKVAKHLDGVHAPKDHIVGLMGVCDDLGSLLDGQYALFNTTVDGDVYADSDDAPLFSDDEDDE